MAIGSLADQPGQHNDAGLCLDGFYRNVRGSQSRPIMDRWTICNKGHIHWGADGAAGFLFCCTTGEAGPLYLLQLRSRSVDEAGKWGVPGGAIRSGESPEDTARREAEEEIGPLPPYKVTGVEVQDCGGGWKFFLVGAAVSRPFAAYCVRETDATGWFTRKDMETLALHPGLQEWFSSH